MTAAVSEELKYCQGLMEQPLLEKVVAIRAALPGAAGNAEALRPLLASARFACRIFYSLNSLGLTEVRPIRTIEGLGFTILRFRPYTPRTSQAP